MKEDDVVTAAALIRQESTRTEKCRGEEQLLVSTTEVCSERKGSELSTFMSLHKVDHFCIFNWITGISVGNVLFCKPRIWWNYIIIIIIILLLRHKNHLVSVRKRSCFCSTRLIKDTSFFCCKLTRRLVKNTFFFPSCKLF